MKRILIAGTAIALFAVPAHAQLLGGGGLGGTLGGAVGGTLGGAGSIGSFPTDTIDNTTRGTLDARGSGSGSAHADRRSGRVNADGQGSGSLLGDLDSTVSTPTRSSNARASGGESASGGGSASAQLVGTDAVRGLAGSAVSQAHGTMQQGRAAAQGLLVTPAALSGSAQGSGSGSGAGSASSGPLAGATSLAGTGQGQGGFLVESGTPIFEADGDKIGKVRQVFTDAHGHVQQLLVKVDGETATLPASNFQANGHGIVSAMGETQIKQLAQQQEAQQRR
jgi:hypothetical protein